MSGSAAAATAATAEPLGILAGGGDLPARVAEAAAAAGRPVFVVVLGGHGDPTAFARVPHAELRLGAAGRMLDMFRERGVRQLVLAGRVARPSLASLRPDAGAARILARIGRAAFGGDDTMLSALIHALEAEGFEVLGAERLLADLLPPPGPLTPHGAPDEAARADIRRGVAVLRALGPLDVGQSVVVQQGLVLGVEAIEGTDALLRRCAALRRDGPGGVLVKLVKRGQTRLADLPTIGPATLRNAAEAGLRGLAIEGGGTIVMDRAATIAMAEEAGLFLLALDPETLDTEETTA